MTATDTTDEPPSPPAADVALVVLAAGAGTRMRSRLPKPLHPVAGLPMVSHVLRAGAGAEPATTVVVVGTATTDLVERLGLGSDVRSVVQDPPLGTGDAVCKALSEVGDASLILVLLGDQPLLTQETTRRLVEAARQTRALVTLLTCVFPDGAAYGRIARDAANRPIDIVELKADLPENRVGATEVWSGLMVLDAAWARTALPDLAPNPFSGEYYLTDLVAMAASTGANADGSWPVATIEAEQEVAHGINDRVDLARAEAIARERIRHHHMRSGVTIALPETVLIDEDVEIGPDTVILPHCMLLAGTRIGRDCRIGPQAVLERAVIGDGVIVRSSTITDSLVAGGADVGPYSHLRAGVQIGPGVHVGNYVEMKNTVVEADVKVGHVSYLGDTHIGARTNIGAGTITANYDGVQKHQTTIGPDVFVGSDSILIAPVEIGEGGRIGAGAVVTKDVPAGATVVGVPARVVRRQSEGRTENGETPGEGSS